MIAEYCPLNDINDRIHIIFGAFFNYKSISNAWVFADLIAVYLEITRYIASGLSVKAFSYKQGHRKQFFSGQANQLQKCVYTEFRVMIEWL